MSLIQDIDSIHIKVSTDRLKDIQTVLEDFYKRELEAITRLKEINFPTNDEEVEALRLACEAIDDAVNVLTQAFPHAG